MGFDEYISLMPINQQMINSSKSKSFKRQNQRKNSKSTQSLVIQNQH